jgi:hypothetical protein
LLHAAHRRLHLGMTDLQQRLFGWRRLHQPTANPLRWLLTIPSAPGYDRIDALFRPGGDSAIGFIGSATSVGTTGGRAWFIRAKAGFQDAAEALARKEHPVGGNGVAEARQNG